jgi:arsenite methyltransferase
MQFGRSDAEGLRFSDESFDAVICECAFCNFPDKAGSARGFSACFAEEVRWASANLQRRTVEGYMAFLSDAGFSLGTIKQQNDALEEMVNQVRLKLHSEPAIRTVVNSANQIITHARGMDPI